MASHFEPPWNPTYFALAIPGREGGEQSIAAGRRTAARRTAARQRALTRERTP